MKNLFRFALMVLSSLAPLTAATPREIIDEQVPQARAILEAWQQGAPTNMKRDLHVVYWTPSDRGPAPEYRQRLTRVMESIRDFYAAEMKSLGFGPQTINLIYDEDKLLKIHLIKAPKPYAQYKPSDGNKIRLECWTVLKQAGIDPDKETVIIFCNMSNWDPQNMRMTQNSPYFARGTHRSGVAWQVDSPLLDPVLLPKKEPVIRDGQYGKISVGKYNSIFVGGVAHELGHALGLPHNCERADERAAQGIALMGWGNRTYGRDLRGEGKGSFLTLASGLRCASHPMFTGSIKGMELRGAASLTDLKITGGNKSIHVSGKVVLAPGSPPVHAILAYTDPEGGSNYDATTATAIPDPEGKFALHCTDLKRRGPASLRLIILYANGDATSHIGIRSPYTYPYSVDQDGQPDLTSITVISAFAPVTTAIKNRDQSAIQQALQTIANSDSPKAAAIAKRILRNKPLHPRPDQIDAGTASIALSDSTATSAKVGYYRPMYNYLPTPNMILQSASSIFEHGIYAHAPARHSYTLGGKWKNLTGSCGIAQSSNGSVVFVIKADGKQIWRSHRIESGRLARYNLDVSGKNNLELIVEDGGDGNASDWGLWLEPTLTR